MRLLVLVLLLGLAAGARASPGELAQAMAEIRRTGCGGRPGVQPPLVPHPQVAQAAGLVARGEAGLEALRRSGYRAVRFVHIALRGHGSAGAAAQALARNHCQALLDPQLVDVGIHQQGAARWVLLAAPLQPPPAEASGDIAQRVLALANAARARPRQCGSRAFQPAPPLALDARLTRAAAAHARDMAARSVMAHEGGDGSSFDERIDRTGYAWRSVGENVAAGQTTADAVMRDWLQSPGHCANLMNPAFTQMGVAFAVNRASDDVTYWAQVFARPR